MTRVPVRTDRAPGAIGPYSQAIVSDGLLFASGQVALDPATGAFAGGDVGAQTERVLQNLQAVLEQGGASLADVLRTTVYLRDMADFAAMNAVYARFFPGAPPARSTVAVAGLPKDARVEIDAIARVP
ncbi:MAG: RidA family protein [Planctomycetes bacterium]|nr:RidA family protein [Planctomycetota bacterium]